MSALLCPLATPTVLLGFLLPLTWGIYSWLSVSNSENAHEGYHLSKTLGITQPPVAPLCRTPHLNNKQNKNTNPVISRQDHHLTQPRHSEEKQANKNSAQISPYVKLIQTTGPILGGQKPKGRKNSTLKPGKKETSNTINSKK